MKTCAEDRVEMMQKMMERKHKRCAKKFSEEDKAELMEMGLKIQGYNCFKEMFHSACQKSVKSQIYAFFQLHMLGGNVPSWGFKYLFLKKISLVDGISGPGNGRCFN